MPGEAVGRTSLGPLERELVELVELVVAEVKRQEGEEEEALVEQVGKELSKEGDGSHHACPGRETKHATCNCATCHHGSPNVR